MLTICNEWSTHEAPERSRQSSADLPLTVIEVAALAACRF